MAASHALDLAAYFTRIGYTGPSESTLAVLRALQLQHMMAVPFENLDVRLGRHIAIEPVTLERKIVRERRGDPTLRLYSRPRACLPCICRNRLRSARNDLKGSDTRRLAV